MLRAVIRKNRFVRCSTHFLVDEWVTNISFSAYYEACAPQSCSFPYTVRATVFTVLTTLMGFFGGVTFAVEIVFLILLRLVEELAFAARLTRPNLLHGIRTWFTCAAQERMIRQLHFVFVLAVVSTLYLLKALSPRLITVQIARPSLRVYEDLIDYFPSTLDCACSQISMRHSSFLNVGTAAHQVCSSAFVSDGWIASLNRNDSFPSEPFLLLSSLCLWSQKSLQDSLDQLYATDFISTAPISPAVFVALINTAIDDIRSIASRSFLSLFSLSRQITGTNQIITALSTNWQLVRPDWNTTERIVPTEPLTYQSCSCAQSSSCAEPSRGMFVGCYPLEALLQADLSCLYNQSCIDPSSTFPALNQSQTSRFSLTTTVEQIIGDLMIEEWLNRISYEDYFDHCAPTLCSYSYTTKGDRVQGLTILVSLYGGLMVYRSMVGSDCRSHRSMLRRSESPFAIDIRQRYPRYFLAFSSVNKEERALMTDINAAPAVSLLSFSMASWFRPTAPPVNPKQRIFGSAENAIMRTSQQRQGYMKVFEVLHLQGPHISLEDLSTAVHRLQYRHPFLRSRLTGQSCDTRQFSGRGR